MSLNVKTIIFLFLLTLFMLNTTCPVLANSVDPDQLQGWQNAGKYVYFPYQWYLPANTGKYWQILVDWIYHPGIYTITYIQHSKG